MYHPYRNSYIFISRKNGTVIVPHTRKLSYFKNVFKTFFLQTVFLSFSSPVKIAVKSFCLSAYLLVIKLLLTITLLSGEIIFCWLFCLSSLLCRRLSHFVRIKLQSIFQGILVFHRKLCLGALSQVGDHHWGKFVQRKQFTRTVLLSHCIPQGDDAHSS